MAFRDKQFRAMQNIGRQVVRAHLGHLGNHYVERSRSMACARPFFKAFRFKRFKGGFRIGIVNSYFEGLTGMVLLKGKKAVGIIRISFCIEKGKRIVSVDAIQGKAHGDEMQENAPLEAKRDFETANGKSWAEALVQHALDVAYNARAFEVFRIVASDAQEYAQGNTEAARKLREQFKAVYDWTANKVGIKRRVGDYWTLKLP